MEAHRRGSQTDFGIKNLLLRSSNVNDEQSESYPFTKIIAKILFRFTRPMNLENCLLWYCIHPKAILYFARYPGPLTNVSKILHNTVHERMVDKFEKVIAF